MSNVAILGASWGDEGKAKIVHDFSVNYDWAIRFAGGDNCGGKVIRNGKSYIHHLLPAIDYANSKARAFLASGMVINLSSLYEEILTMQQDFPHVATNTYVDPDAFVVLPEHIAEDKITGVAQGTTYRGIKQSYRSKVDRTGTRVYNLINDNATIIQKLTKLGVQFKTAMEMRPIFEKSKLLFEGNQGIMLDLNSGIFPYITSSDCTVSGIYSAGFHWLELDHVFGVAKGGYITRSGGRPMPTEQIPEEEAQALVERGVERGNTTGRPRGVAYMDLMALKYAVGRAGITSLILTKLDISNGQDKIKVCHSYGKEVYSPNDFQHVEPRYITVQGWQDASDITQVAPFIKLVQDKVGIPMTYYSHGVGREHLKHWYNYIEVDSGKRYVA